MATTVYKSVSKVRWNAGTTYINSGSGGGGLSLVDINTLLMNYYTISQLQASGQSQINFDNIFGAYHNNLLSIQGGLDTSSGDSSGYDAEYYHLDLSTYLDIRNISFVSSVNKDSVNAVSLVNDEDDPGILKYYGTDISGIKGWFDLPEGDSSGGGGDVSIYGTPVADQIVVWADATHIKGITNFTYDFTNAGNAVLSIPGHQMFLGDPTADGGTGFYYIYGNDATTAEYPYGVSIYIKGGTSYEDSENYGIGGCIYIEGGDAGTGSDAGVVEIIGGTGDLGGVVRIKGGVGNVISGGSIYLTPGAGVTGEGTLYLDAAKISMPDLPAKSSETNIVFYNTTSKLISYGAGVLANPAGTSGQVAIFNGSSSITGYTAFTYNNGAAWLTLGTGNNNPAFWILTRNGYGDTGESMNGMNLIIKGGNGFSYSGTTGLGGTIALAGGESQYGTAGSVTIYGGVGDTGGSVYISGGAGDSTDGDIFFGKGSQGTLPAKTSETNVVYYDPTTGKISYGEVEGDSSGGFFPYVFDMSLVEDSLGIVTLENDLASPGNNMYYGTDSSGTKGWHELTKGFQTISFANPLNINCSTYKDWICVVTGDCTVNLNNVSDGDAGMLELIIDASGVDITLGAMWTKKMGPTDLDMTDGADNIISWKAIGDGSTQEIVYTVGIIEV